jgi:hypothetical protein
MDTGFVLAGSTYDNRGTRAGKKLFIAHLRQNGDFEWQRSHDLVDWASETTAEVQMLGTDGFIVTGTVSGGVPPELDTNPFFSQYSTQGFAIRVPMNGSLDTFAGPGVLQVRNTSIKPVVTKAKAVVTTAMASDFTFYHIDNYGIGRVTEPLPR